MTTTGRRQAACAKIRVLCPTRPSPIVVRRLLKVAQPRPTAAEVTADKATEDDRKNNTEKSPKSVDSSRKGGKKGKRAKPTASGERGAKEGGRGGKGGSVLPSWLYVHLPFHDDESFAIFFCELLVDSERLAVSFG